MERRVVITGLGAITPIGNNTNDFWKGIQEGKCGIDKKIICSFLQTLRGKRSGGEK